MTCLVSRLPQLGWKYQKMLDGIAAESLQERGDNPVLRRPYNQTVRQLHDQGMIIAWYTWSPEQSKAASVWMTSDGWKRVSDPIRALRRLRSKK